MQKYFGIEKRKNSEADIYICEYKFVKTHHIPGDDMCYAPDRDIVMVKDRNSDKVFELPSEFFGTPAAAITYLKSNYLRMCKSLFDSGGTYTDMDPDWYAAQVQKVMDEYKNLKIIVEYYDENKEDLVMFTPSKENRRKQAMKGK